MNARCRIFFLWASVFTFQAMSYTIDVFRGRMQAIPRFTDFALFVSFFFDWLQGPSCARPVSCSN